MQTVSSTYQTLRSQGAPKEVQAVIGTGSGNENYEQNRIVSAVTKSSVMDKAATIGNCIAKELNLVVRNPGTIPRMALISMRYRLNNGTTHSEWIPKGKFYVDTREEGNGVLTLTAYDPMLFSDKPYTNIGRQGLWPRETYKTGSNESERGVVNVIAGRIGVEIDPRTAELLSANPISVPYPGEGVYTMREMLGYIGAMYGGNWIITDENKLRLIVLGDIPDEETNLLITEYAEYILIGGYRIIVR